MKTKILLFLLCQCWFALTYAQGTNTKPTKEETMKWIADKIYATRIPDISSMSYANGLIIFKLEPGSIYYELNLIALTSLDTGIAGKSVTSYSTEKKDIRGDTVFIRRLILKGAGLIKQYSGNQYKTLTSINLLRAQAYSDPDAKSISDIFLVEGLYDRMIKALKVLIEYNTAPAKDEKF